MNLSMRTAPLFGDGPVERAGVGARGVLLGAAVAAVATANATAKAIVSALRRGLIDALSGRAGRFISFASPKETNQRKGRATLRSAWRVAKRQAAKLWRSPASAPRQAGVPSLQTIERWLRNSLAALAQTVLAEFPPACLPLGASEGDPVAHPHPRPLSLKEKSDACQCLRTNSTAGGCSEQTSNSFADPRSLHPTVFPPVTQAPRKWRETLGSRPTEGTPEGRKARVAFSLVRFFWPRKRNEPARPAAKGINQTAPQALSLSEVAVAVAVATAAAAATAAAIVPGLAGEAPQ